MRQFKYIAAITDAELLNSVVIPCINENGKHCVLVKNTSKKTISSVIYTNDLEVKLNATLQTEGGTYYFHILQCRSTEAETVEQFAVINDYLFKKMDKPISDSEFIILITSIENIFRKTKTTDLFQLQVGVYGELITIKTLYDEGFAEIIEKYHSNFFSKHDIEFSKTCRAEIKATVGEHRIHHFKHNQISRSDVKVFVFSLLLEESQEGMSLYELFDDIIQYFSDPDVLLSLYATKKRCQVSMDEPGIRIAWNNASENLRIYSADDLPKLDVDSPEGISNISYDVDCSLAHSIPTHVFIEYIKLAT